MSESTEWQLVRLQDQDMWLRLDAKGRLQARDGELKTELVAARLTGSLAGLGGFALLFEQLTEGMPQSSAETLLGACAFSTRALPAPSPELALAWCMWEGSFSEKALMELGQRPSWARHIVRNPLVSPEVLGRCAETLGEDCEYEFKVEMAKNPRMPVPVLKQLLRTGSYAPLLQVSMQKRIDDFERESEPAL